jgi:hypothetical protein
MRPTLKRFAIAAFAGAVAFTAFGLAPAEAHPISCFNCYGVYGGPFYAYQGPYFAPYRYHYRRGYNRWHGYRHWR